MLTATCSDSYVEKSKNHKKVILLSSTLTLAMWWWVISPFYDFLLFSMYESLQVAVKVYTNYNFYIFSGTGKATKFKFCMPIYRLIRNKIPLKCLEK